MRRKRLGLCLLFATCIVVSLVLQTVDYSPVEVTIENSLNPERKAITAGIYITSNAGFLPNGFTGYGNETHPYVLDGAIITTPTSGVGIYITTTSAHFVIQNCVVNLTSTSSSYGIYFDTIDNGTVADCEVLGTGTGIYVRASNSVNVTGTTIDECTNMGIDVYLSSKVNLIDDTITDCVWRGVGVSQSPNVTLSNNLVNRINYDSAQSSSWGFDCQNSDNLTITNNEVRSTMRGYGMYVESGNNVLIDSNLIWKASTGLLVYSTPAVVISNNNISCGYNYDLLMSTVVDAHVFGNSLHHTENANGRAIHLTSCSDGLFEYNDLFKCWYGFSVDSNSGNNTISENSIGWCDLYYAYDARTSAPQNNWTSNQFSDWTLNPYPISGAAGVSDASASLLSDSISPTIDSPADIVIDDVDTNKWVTWHVDDRFPGDYMLRINYTGSTVYTWCNSSISISLDALAPGVYDYTVDAYDASNFNYAEDTVRITVLDTQPPVFTSATGDYTIEFGQRVWTNFTATDDTPAIKRGWADDSEVPWNDAWTSPLTLNWDHVMPGKGIHNYTVMLTDKAGNFAIATTIVTIEDTTAPTAPDFPSDFSAEAGDVAWVNFTLNDPYYASYQIWLDNTMDVEQPYTDGQYIPYMLNFASPYEHNVTLVAWDEDLNTMKATCIVTYVDTTGPEIEGLDDFTIEAGDSSIASWNWTELNPENYTIYENNTQGAFSTSFSSEIQYSLSGLTPGLWNITLIIYDDSGNFAVDELWVTVEDTTAPTLNGFTSLDVEFGLVLQINWQVNNIDPWDQDGSWSVEVNETEDASGVWDSSQVSYQLSPVIAIYNVTVIVTDAYGNSVTFTTWVTCQDTVSPEITGVTDQEISESESVLLNWTCSDLDPAWLTLTRNGSEFVDQVWDGSDYSYLVEGLAPGVYNFTLLIIDGSGNSISDTVIVTIAEEVTITTTPTTTTTTSTTTTSPTTTAPSNPPDEGTVMMLVLAGVGGVIVIVIVALYLKKKK